MFPWLGSGGTPRDIIRESRPTPQSSQSRLGSSPFSPPTSTSSQPRAVEYIIEFDFPRFVKLVILMLLWYVLGLLAWTYKWVLLMFNLVLLPVCIQLSPEGQGVAIYFNHIRTYCSSVNPVLLSLADIIWVNILFIFEAFITFLSSVETRPRTSSTTGDGQRRRTQNPEQSFGSGLWNIFSSVWTQLTTEVTAEDYERLDASGEWLYRQPFRNESRTCYSWQAAGWKTAEQATEFSNYVESKGSHLNCPITQDVIVDAVVAADGYTYERAAIKEWLRSRRTNAVSPMTGQPMQSFSLIRNWQYHSNLSSLKESFLGRLSPAELSRMNTDLLAESAPPQHSESLFTGAAREGVLRLRSWLSNTMSTPGGTSRSGSGRSSQQRHGHFE